MSTAASRKWTNIRRSIQSRIGNFVVVNGYSAPIFYDYYYADPDGNRTGSGAYRMWAEAFFIESTAGRKGEAILQIDCYSRVGEEDDVSSDQFGSLFGGRCHRTTERYLSRHGLCRRKQSCGRRHVPLHDKFTGKHWRARRAKASGLLSRLPTCYN